MLSSPGDINVKNIAFTPYCGVGVVGGGGGERDSSKHLPWPRYRLQYLVSASVLAGRGGAVVTNAFHSYNMCWYMHVLYNNGNEHGR